MGWSVVNQREGVIRLANGTFTDGVIITVQVDAQGDEITTGVAQVNYNPTHVQTVIADAYAKWQAVQALTGG
jgi:hypothetical protein